MATTRTASRLASAVLLVVLSSSAYTTLAHAAHARGQNSTRAERPQTRNTLRDTRGRQTLPRAGAARDPDAVGQPRVQPKPPAAPRLSDAAVGDIYAAMGALPQRNALRAQHTRQARPNSMLRRLLEIMEPSAKTIEQPAEPPAGKTGPPAAWLLEQAQGAAPLPSAPARSSSTGPRGGRDTRTGPTANTSATNTTTTNTTGALPAPPRRPMPHVVLPATIAADLGAVLRPADQLPPPADEIPGAAVPRLGAASTASFPVVLQEALAATARLGASLGADTNEQTDLLLIREVLRGTPLANLAVAERAGAPPVRGEPHERQKTLQELLADDARTPPVECDSAPAGVAGCDEATAQDSTNAAGASPAIAAGVGNASSPPELVYKWTVPPGGSRDDVFDDDYDDSGSATWAKQPDWTEEDDEGPWTEDDETGTWTGNDDDVGRTQHGDDGPDLAEWGYRWGDRVPGLPPPRAGTPVPPPLVIPDLQWDYPVGP